MTATKQIVECDIGYAILTAEGYSTIDEIVFAEEGDMSLAVPERPDHPPPSRPRTPQNRVFEPFWAILKKK